MCKNTMGTCATQTTFSAPAQVVEMCGGCGTSDIALM